jgi:membrane protein YqaA with SNARE-associated domain
MQLTDPASMALFFSNFVYASPFGIIVLFLFTVFANASLFLPILVEPIVFVVAGFAPNAWIALLIGVVTGIGAAIGEMSGYILGLLGIKTLKKMSEKKVDQILEIGENLANKGMPIIFLGAFTPFPFDLVGIAAGLIRYDPKRFFVAAMLGKVLRYGLVAFLGFVGINALPWLAHLLGL